MSFALGTHPAPAQTQVQTLERIIVPAPSLESNTLHEPAHDDVRIYLPRDYASNPTKRYPVIYVLHGFSLAPVLDDWSEVVAEDMAAFLKTYPTRDAIVVVPNGSDRLYGTYYVNSPVRGRWEDFIVSDLVRYVDGHYRSIPDARSRAIVGHSMGGFGALRIGMRHPDVFSVVYAMSPCCLDFIKDMTSSNPDWKKLLALHSADELGAAAKKHEFYVVAWGALATALTPDTGSPMMSQLPYALRNGAIVPRSDVIGRWKSQLPVNMVSRYATALRKLRALGVDYGLQDPFTHIPAGAAELAQRFTAAGVPFTLSAYAGDHNNMVPSRFASIVLPFITNALDFQTGEKGATHE